MPEDTNGAAPQTGFNIGGRFYAWPAKFRLGDPVLIEELTGLAYHDFLARLPDVDSPDDEDLDPVASLGLIGVAIWQTNPSWRRDRVVRYAQSLDKESVEIIVPEQDAEPVEGDPDYQAPATVAAGDGDPLPTAPDGPNISETSAMPSGSDTAIPSGAPTPPTTGQQD